MAAACTYDSGQGWRDSMMWKPLREGGSQLLCATVMLIRGADSLAQSAATAAIGCVKTDLDCKECRLQETWTIQDGKFTDFSAH